MSPAEKMTLKPPVPGRVLVTGGAGFIGSQIVAALDAVGAPVVVCDTLGEDEKWKNIAKRELVDFVRPADLPSWLQSVSRLAAIIHMGAISSTTVRDGDLTLATNFNLSLDLWNWCAERRVPFIYASSAATYGDGAEGFVDDWSCTALARLRPLNLYGFSKHLFDRRVARLIQEGSPHPPQYCGLKFFNVYGPHEYHKGSMQSVVAHLYPQIVRGEPARLFKSYRPDYPDGGQLRDFVYVKDCVEVIFWLLRHPEVSGIFNVGTGIARSFADLARTTMRAAGYEPRLEYIDMPETLREKYQYFTQADMSRLRAAGYDRPMTSLEEGVTDYVTNYLQKPDRYL